MSQRIVTKDGVIVVPGGSWQHPNVRKEHDPSLKAEDTPSAIVQEWHKPITFEGLMETIEKEPLLKMILDARVAAFARMPILKYSGYQIEYKVPEPIEYHCKGYMIYEGPMDAIKACVPPGIEKMYERDPFWQQWRAAQAKAGEGMWRTPIFMAESEMDWDSEEEDTDPGIGPAVAHAPADPIVCGSGPYQTPTFDIDGIAKSDVCYLCGTGRGIVHFNRSLTDTLIACVHCIEVHLGWKLNRDGTLTRVEPDL